MYKSTMSFNLSLEQERSNPMLDSSTYSQSKPRIPDIIRFDLRADHHKKYPTE